MADSETKNYKFPVPYAGHVQAMHATQTALEMIDEKLYEIENDGGTNPPVEKERPLVILCAGTSNAFTTAPCPVGTYPENIHIWQWTNAIGEVGTGFVTAETRGTRRLDLEFALEHARDNPNRDVYVINISFGAGVLTSWSANTPFAYGTTLTDNLTAAMAQIEGAERVDYFLWWNGEADTANDALRNAYQANFNSFMDNLSAVPAFDRDHCKTILFGIVDAPRAPWRNHSQLNYINKQITALSGGTMTYIQTGVLNDARYWQPNIGTTVSPLLNETGLITVGRRAHNVVTNGNSTFNAATHGDNGVANVLEVFRAIMLPQYEFGAQVPAIEHDFQSTLKCYQTRYRGDFAHNLNPEATVSRRATWEERVGEGYTADAIIEWSGSTITDPLNLPGFMPFENNRNDAFVFASAVLRTGAAGAGATRRRVNLHWVLWTRDLIMVDDDFQPVAVPPQGSLTFSVSAYRT